MPESGYWQTFFDAGSILKRLVPLEKPGAILEFGSGYGTFTLPLAQAGHEVLGLDIEADLVHALQQEAQAQGRGNLEVQVRDFVVDGTGVPDGAVDHVLLYNILHIEDPVALLREALRILKPGATASIIHWRRDIPTPRGPSLEIRPTADQSRTWALEAGFVAATEIPLGDAAPYHYGIVVHKNRNEE